MTTPQRLMLKPSGEAFSKEGKGQGIHQPTLHDVAEAIAAVTKTGVQLVIVVGGGNIWRYRDSPDQRI